ncbi:hypothetical protein [Sporichthya polymorpha]|nr:hypothetical protein [Sporichthya polymorpha]
MGEIDDLKRKAEESMNPVEEKVEDSKDKTHQVRGSLGQAAEDLTEELE